MSGDRISVVVVNYRSAEEVEGFVASLATSDITPHEVIVVDNASGDDSVERLSGRDDLRLIASALNTGFGGGCNLGAAAATGDLIFISNPDVRLRPDTLTALLRALRDDPKLAIACPDLLGAPDPSYVGKRYDEPVASMAGAAMLVDAAAFTALGGFDDHIFLYSEDADLCYRTWLSGRGVAKVWDAIGDHLAHGAGGGRQWSHEQIKNGLYVFLKLRDKRSIVRHGGRMAVKTVVRGVRGRDPRVLTAWWSNARDLPSTLRKRHTVRGGATPEDRARLDALCLQHDYWVRTHYRREVLASARRKLRLGR
ncbi:MAG: glycosyl transferase family 2 [Conexibacter sp.]|nr:glycosyl transferase family 2 [Conexibacter sp.]